MARDTRNDSLAPQSRRRISQPIPMILGQTEGEVERVDRFFLRYSTASRRYFRAQELEVE